MPETIPLAVPKTLNDRYVIERELGHGGMATVYLARDLRHERLVAVKVLRPEVAAALGADRFLREIRVTAGLQHPNILPLIDSGGGRRAEGGEDFVYYVTPYVDGETLRQRLQREPQLPVDEAVRIASGVAAGLDFAHRHRVIHRDVKPENILLSDGQPVIADFGIAFSLAAAGERLTETGLSLGTPAYMSPEQALADRVIDGRSDQYSLATVLYEMLVGEPPFTGPTAQTILARLMSEPPPRLTAVRLVPRIIERAINRGLAKSPADRFRTVGEFAAALNGANVAPARSPRRWRAVAVAAVVVLAVAAAGVMASRAVASRRSAGPVAHRQLTFSGTATLPALSPDGRSVVYVAGGRSLVRQGLDGGSPLVLVPPVRGIWGARWTGDGKAIVVAMMKDSTELAATYLIPASGGPARKVLDDWPPFDAGPDTTVIVRAPRERRNLELVSLATGKSTRTIAVPDTVGEIGEVAWSPDARWIAFAGADDELWVVSAGGGTPSQVADGARKIRWAPGSDALYFLTGPLGAVDLMVVRIDRQTGRSAGTATRAMSLLTADAFDIGRGSGFVHTQTSPSAQVRTFVFGGDVPRRLVEERPLTEGTARVHSASISPDGESVAYSVARGTEVEIHIVPFAGGPARLVAASPAREDAPTWSPDGTRLAFAREDSTGRALMVTGVNSDAPQRVGYLPGPGVWGADQFGPLFGPGRGEWSASGRHLAYFSTDLGRIGLVNLQRQNESMIHIPDSIGTGYFFVVPSPNGTQVIASTLRRANDWGEIWLVFGNGRKWRKLRGPFGESFPIAWHRNSWIYMLRNRALATDHGSMYLDLWRMRGPDGPPEYYAPLPAGCGVGTSLSADASRGVCNYIHVESDLYVTSNFGPTSR